VRLTVQDGRAGFGDLGGDAAGTCCMWAGLFPPASSMVGTPIAA